MEHEHVTSAEIKWNQRMDNTLDKRCNGERRSTRTLFLLYVLYGIASCGIWFLTGLILLLYRIGKGVRNETKVSLKICNNGKYGFSYHFPWTSIQLSTFHVPSKTSTFYSLPFYPNRKYRGTEEIWEVHKAVLSS